MDKPPSTVDDDNDYDNDIPLQHRHPFGSGLHRKTIAFVPAAEKTESVTEAASRPKPDPKAISDIYLNLVLSSSKEEGKGENKTPESTHGAKEADHQNPPPTGSTQICSVCNLPLESTSAPHETSLAHQIGLPHSHPPSALDRSRMGLSYLATYGWDPDARRGLGAAQQGIQFPLKTKPKDDRLGIGVNAPKNNPLAVKKEKEKGRLLDAGKVRKLVREENRKAERMRQQLFGSKDLEKYLGPGGAG